MPINLNADVASTVIAQNRTQAPAASAPVRPVVDVNGRQVPAAAVTENGKELPEQAVQQLSGNGNNPAATSELQQAVSDINSYVQTVNRELQFRIDEALPLGRSVITVVDSETDETIREIPSKEALALAQRIVEQRAEEALSQTTEGLIISAQA